MPSAPLSALGSELDSLLIAVVAICGMYVFAWAAVRVRIRRPPRPRRAVSSLLARAPSFLGVALALTPLEAQAWSRFFDPPPSRAHQPPWSRVRGSPPPRPLAREGARNPSSHPAIHANRRDEKFHDRLFPRAGSACRTHTVAAGDTLWGIAARVLATDDPRRIARYWPKIHRANRAAVPDPNLIRPGQVLRLPDECDA